MNVIEKISEQQKKLKDTEPAWMVGEQLKDICRDPKCAELVGVDLDNPAMSLTKCEAKIHEYANRNHKGQSFCVSPRVAEGIIREFYGLPKAGEAPAPEAKPSGIIDLADLL